jgi:nitrate reductase NapAB chaperone NapD
MPICSYLVVPAADRTAAVMAELGALPGCHVERADQHDLIALVTDTASPAEEKALRSRLERVEDIYAMVLTFGELEPERGGS